MKKIKIAHFGLHTPGNAGDTMLFKVTQKAISEIAKKQDIAIEFVNFSVHTLVTEKIIDQANQADLIICGGGGLFLRDTKANENSGWQWNLPISLISLFRKPLALFGVGYNRFRGQKEFDGIFKTHLNCLATKAEFFGLRNHGSIDRIKAYLEPKHHPKIIYQPCPTTLLSLLDISNLGVSCEKKQEIINTAPNKIILNIPFDRAEMRYGKTKEDILGAITKAMKELTNEFELEIVFHCSNDVNLILDLEKQEVKYSCVHLEMKPYQKVLDYYFDNRHQIILSGRGHGQMIPFGWGSLFISLISHDKLGYFLVDTNLEAQGIEVTAQHLKDRLVKTVRETVKNKNLIRERISLAKSKLFSITEANISRLLALVVNQ